MVEIAFFALQNIHTIYIEQGKVRMKGGNLLSGSRFGRGENGANSNGKSKDD